jgi:hypothetical protein
VTEKISNDESARSSYLPQEFERMLTALLLSTDKLAEAVLAVAAAREPDRYGEAAELVRSGRLVPHVVSSPGLVVVSLVDSQDGRNIGEILSYRAPALEARGAPH